MAKCIFPAALQGTHYSYSLGFETDQMPVESPTYLQQSCGLNIFISLCALKLVQDQDSPLFTLLVVFISASPTENKKRTDCESLSPTHAFTLPRNPCEVCTFFLHCIPAGLFVRFTFNQV